MRRYPAHAVLVDFPHRLAGGEVVDLEAIEREFFDRLKNGNGTYKTTNRFRLDEVDGAFISLLRDYQAGELEVLDFAASSGVTSLRMIETLRANGFAPRLTISDLTAFAYLLAPVPWFRALVDGRGRPLEFEIFSRSVPMRPKKRDLVTGNVFFIMAARALYRCFARARPAEFADTADGRNRGSPGSGKVLKLPLVSNDVRCRSDVLVVEDDVTAANPDAMRGKFDVIRAANILQACYFDEPTVRLALANLRGRLKGDGSWLIVGRTHDLGANHASVFRLENGRFAVKSRVGNGSEVEKLVLETR